MSASCDLYTQIWFNYIYYPLHKKDNPPSAVYDNLCLLLFSPVSHYLVFRLNTQVLKGRFKKWQRRLSLFKWKIKVLHPKESVITVRQFEVIYFCSYSWDACFRVVLKKPSMIQFSFPASSTTTHTSACDCLFLAGFAECSREGNAAVLILSFVQCH